MGRAVVVVMGFVPNNVRRYNPAGIYHFLSCTFGTFAPHLLMLADLAAAASETHAPHLRMLADAAAAAIDTHAPHLLMLADLAAAASDTYAPALVVLAEGAREPLLPLGFRHEEGNRQFSTKLEPCALTLG